MVGQNLRNLVICKGSLDVHRTTVLSFEPFLHVILGKTRKGRASSLEETLSLGPYKHGVRPVLTVSMAPRTKKCLLAFSRTLPLLLTLKCFDLAWPTYHLAPPTSWISRPRCVSARLKTPGSYPFMRYFIRQQLLDPQILKKKQPHKHPGAPGFSSQAAQKEKPRRGTKMPTTLSHEAPQNCTLMRSNHSYDIASCEWLAIIVRNTEYKLSVMRLCSCHYFH